MWFECHFGGVLALGSVTAAGSAFAVGALGIFGSGSENDTRVLEGSARREQEGIKDGLTVFLTKKRELKKYQLVREVS